MSWSDGRLARPFSWISNGHVGEDVLVRPLLIQAAPPKLGADL